MHVGLPEWSAVRPKTGFYRRWDDLGELFTKHFGLGSGGAERPIHIFWEPNDDPAEFLALHDIAGSRRSLSG